LLLHGAVFLLMFALLRASIPDNALEVNIFRYLHNTKNCIRYVLEI
jgi:hypothetical protein